MAIFLAGMFIFGGLMVVTMSLDKIAREISRSNDLKEAALRNAGAEKRQEDLPS